MCFQSIYKRIRKDFEFLIEFGYSYECDVKHYVQPHVKFRKSNYFLLIGYAYDIKRFFVSFFNDNVRDILSDKNLNEKNLFKDGHVKPIYVVGENTVLSGSSYQEQLDTVKKIVKEFLANNF